MPDISMRTGVGCARRADCYRHTATPNRVGGVDYQSWFAAPPLAADGTCDYFKLDARAPSNPRRQARLLEAAVENHQKQHERKHL